jgi:hypothetical protein
MKELCGTSFLLLCLLHGPRKKIEIECTIIRVGQRKNERFVREQPNELRTNSETNVMNWTFRIQNIYSVFTGLRINYCSRPVHFVYISMKMFNIANFVVPAKARSYIYHIFNIFPA